MAIYIVILISGLLAGCIITRLIFKPKDSGVLRIYRMDPNEAYQLYAELNIPLEEVSKNSYVIFKVSKTG